MDWGRKLTPEGKSINSPAIDNFPDFMKHPANRIVSASQSTPGVEGYVFDGIDGSQMPFWTCSQTAASAQRTHDYDEYMLVVQGCYTLVINGKRVPVKAGEEYLIPRGVLHGGEVLAGTRTIHAFGGHRANRVKD
jgi:mannose-6-phosphate isomerase-like protein (cupin superfamily)